MPTAAVEALDLVVARRAAGALPGDRRAAGIGQGTELAQLRPYQIGDDVRQIDASATARTGVPHVRLQVPERAVVTWLVLDVSASMAFGSQGRLKSLTGSQPLARNASKTSPRKSIPAKAKRIPGDLLSR